MAAGKQLHGNLTPAHADGCAAQCFEGVQRGSLIILSVHPRPQAATPVLRPGFVAHLFGRGPVLRTCNRVMAHRPTGSTQTDRIRLPYAARRLSLSRWGWEAAWKGAHAAPGPESVQVKIPGWRYDELRFQPPAHIFIHLGSGESRFCIIACPHGQRGYVAGIVPDHPVATASGLPPTAAAITG